MNAPRGIKTTLSLGNLGWSTSVLRALFLHRYKELKICGLLPGILRQRQRKRQRKNRSFMKFIICALFFQSLHYFAFCQNNTERFNGDSLRKIIMGLPEYKEVEKRYDSLSKKIESSTFSIGVTETYSSKMMYATIEAQLDTVRRIFFRIKYDKDQKKITLIEKEN